jgi:hypothetical protein
MLIIITSVIDGCGISLKGGNSNNPLLRFVALGVIMPVVLIIYMLGFAGRITQYHDTD